VTAADLPSFAVSIFQPTTRFFRISNARRAWSRLSHENLSSER
jgi:hypothetical protein